MDTLPKWILISWSHCYHLSEFDCNTPEALGLLLYAVCSNDLTPAIQTCGLPRSISAVGSGIHYSLFYLTNNIISVQARRWPQDPGIPQATAMMTCEIHLNPYLFCDKCWWSQTIKCGNEEWKTRKDV